MEHRRSITTIRSRTEVLAIVIVLYTEQPTFRSIRLRIAGVVLIQNTIIQLRHIRIINLFTRTVQVRELVIIVFVTCQYIQVVYIVECLVVCQQILLVDTECTLCRPTNDTSYTACFRILAIERIDHIRILHIVCIHTDINLGLDAAPNIDIRKPFTANHIACILLFVQHIACQRVGVRDNIGTREVRIRTIVITLHAAFVYHDVPRSITNKHRVDRTDDISRIECVCIRRTAFCILLAAIIMRE